MERAINLLDLTEKINIEKSGANTPTIESVKKDPSVEIVMRQSSYLNNIVGQDLRAIQRITRPMMGFKSFWSAKFVIAGIETMQMVRKGRMECHGGQVKSATTQFYSFVA